MKPSNRVGEIIKDLAVEDANGNLDLARGLIGGV